jgi:hypothetical protein
MIGWIYLAQHQNKLGLCLFFQPVGQRSAVEARQVNKRYICICCTEWTHQEAISAAFIIPATLLCHAHVFYGFFFSSLQGGGKLTGMHGQS